MSSLASLVPPALGAVVSLCVALSAQSLHDLRREDALAVIELQPKIDAAIDRGVAWLLDQQQRDGSWFGHSKPFTGGQTALSAYTLLKAGVPVTHPGIKRALAHLTTVQPLKVYVAGSMLMAFAESKDPDYRPQMERIVAQLLEWQRGSWSYPLQPGDTGLHNDQDLSITQFALLGLRAAARAGIKVPADAWQDALRTTLRYQERPRAADPAGNKLEVAGFRYHLNPQDSPTGSMTTAGLASLWMAREGLGKVPNELGLEVEAALRHGRNWLDVHYSVRDNPKKNDRWLYYLYGLERASAFLDVSYWGDQPWYLDGARVLLDKQGGNGAWAFPEGESDTCFAILFLKRATAATTGKTERGPRVLRSDDASHDVAFKVTGQDDGGAQTLQVTRVRAAAGTRTYVVDKVEYLVGDEVVAMVSGGGNLWREGNDFRARWQPRARGTFKLLVRAHARRADHEGKAVGDTIVLEARTVEVKLLEVLEDWMLKLATWQARNQVSPASVAATASSELEKGRAADLAVDGYEGSAWVCAKADPAPRLALVFEKPVAARTLILTQANGARGHLATFDLVEKVEVFVNGSKTPLVAELAADELMPSRIELGKNVRVKRLEIAIVARAGGKNHKGAAGFAEVALEK